MIDGRIMANAGGPIHDADRVATALLTAVVLTAWLLAVLVGAG